jgi:RsmE family RNA methyltransferase
MNLMLVPEASATLLLDAKDPRAAHVRKVLGMKVGDSFDVGAVNGPRGKATILADDAAGMRLSLTWGDLPPPPLPIRLFAGLSRPQTMRKILREAGPLGFAELHFIRCLRGEASYAESSLWTDGEWRGLLEEGVQQAFSTFVPPVFHHDGVPQALAAAAGCEILFADNYEATAPLARWEGRSGKPVALFVGPERGWDGPERDAARSAGAHLVHLGPRILRTETAVTAAAMLVAARMGALDFMDKL